MDSVYNAAPVADVSLKRKREAPTRTRIVVEIPSKPRRYVWGSGPPPQRISLLPAQDSTAYILERILLPSPGPAANGKPLPKRMTYIVGWHDLPAARMLVPAMKVLEYVSPRALEDWEYNMELEMDKERERMEEEKAQPKPKPKKRGRPPGRGQIEAAVVAEPDNEALKTGRPTTGAMTITTPSKRRLKELEPSSDEEASPSRQLENEMASSVDAGPGEVFDSMDLVGTEADLDPGEETASSKQSTESLGPRGLGASYKAKKLSRSTPDLSLAQPASLGTTPKSSSTPIPSTTKTVKETPIPLPQIPGFPRVLNPSRWSVQRTPSAAAGDGTSFSTIPPSPKPPSDTPSKEPAVKSTQKPKPKEIAKRPKKDPKSTPKMKPSLPQDTEPPQDAGDAEPVWEVKRVKDSEVYEVEGKGRVRYFKVLWEGDWPPEQNPSWEPEENLPPSLVRNFLKRGKKKPTPKKKPPVQQSILPWATASQFKSVGEAFAGGDEVDLVDVANAGADVDEGGDGGGDGFGEQEEFFVVEEPPAKKARKQGSAGWDGRGNGSASRMELGMVSAAFH